MGAVPSVRTSLDNVARRRIALAVGALFVAVLASTFLPDAPSVPPVAVLVASVVAVPPLLLWMFIARHGRRYSRKIGFREYRWIGVVAIGLWLLAASAAIEISLDGFPQVIDGRYVLNDRGEVTIVDRAQYDHSSAILERMVASMAAFACLVVVAQTYAPWTGSGAGLHATAAAR